MKRQSFIACIVCLCGIVVGLSDHQAAAVPPGSSEAQAAQNFDPFNPTAVATATTAATATSSVPNSGLIVTIAACSPASTVVVPSKPCLSVLDPATVVQSKTAKTSVTFVVTLSAKSSSTITVMYETANGTGASGTLYTAKTGTLTFTPGQTSQTVTVTILSSTSAHAVETFYLELWGQSSGATICRAKATAKVQAGVIDVTVSGPGTVQQLPTNCPNPYAAHAVFTVKLSSAATTTVTVKYTTLDGTAIQNLDYVPKSGTLTFPPGTTSETVSVQILPENKTTNEVFYLELTSAAGASGITITVPKASATIRGQNSQIYVAGATVAHGTSGTVNQYARVYLDVKSAEVITVKFITVDGTAKANVDYKAVSTTVTFTPGQVTQSIAIPIIGIKTTVPTRTFKVEIEQPVTGNGFITTSSATMTITGH